MEIRREVLLPVPLETARQRLSTAFASPLVVQRGNLLLAKIVCSGRINGNNLWVRYIEYGRSIVYLDLTGHLEETSDGVRLQMTISSENVSRFLLYTLPVAVIVFFTLRSIRFGVTAESLVGFVFSFIASSGLTLVMHTLVSSFSRMRVTRVEGALVQIIMGSDNR
ncbi:hypothetical protein [Fibrisoma limi]|uniref:hypothetical protein n=1 Tax=Fibrisoma limi TaxID=663275 RepID=UPI001181B8AA|nr:hypothetical protein [Fibrisoma limi]